MKPLWALSFSFIHTCTATLKYENKWKLDGNSVWFLHWTLACVWLYQSLFSGVLPTHLKQDKGGVIVHEFVYWHRAEKDEGMSTTIGEPPLVNHHWWTTIGEHTSKCTGKQVSEQNIWIQNYDMAAWSAMRINCNFSISVIRDWTA